MSIGLGILSLTMSITNYEDVGLNSSHTANFGPFSKKLNLLMIYVDLFL